MTKQLSIFAMILAAVVVFVNNAYISGLIVFGSIVAILMWCGYELEKIEKKEAMKYDSITNH